MITHQLIKLSGRKASKLLSSLAVTLIITISHSLSATSIQLVEAQFLSDNEFKRISEYFNGADNPGNRAIIRSQTDNREGLYLIFELDQSVSNLPSSAVFKVEIIDNLEKLAKSYQFPIDLAKYLKTREVLLGITGSDWPDPDKKALAWRITLTDGKENELAVHESFLWAYPEN